MIAGIILAAGSARRMGCSKQLLPLGGRTMVWQVANAACHSKIDRVILVTGANKAQVAHAVEDLNLVLVHNPEWTTGQASSLKAGLQVLPADAQDFEEAARLRDQIRYYRKLIQPDEEGETRP